jgi:flavodoxin
LRIIPYWYTIHSYPAVFPDQNGRKFLPVGVKAASIRWSFLYEEGGKQKMKALVVYDSVFGNTEKVAQAIGAALGEVQALRVGNVQPEHLAGITVLVVGSPTRAFRPTPATVSFLKGLPAGSLKGVRVAAYDTRMLVDEAPAILKFFVKIFGYAADPMLKLLVKKGGDAALQPEGFFVAGTEGPLKEGELERAAAWVKPLAG